MSGLLQIGPRYVKQAADGPAIRSPEQPVEGQRQALEAIKNADARLIFVAAPGETKGSD